MDSLTPETEYLQAEGQALNNLRTIRQILEMKKPYKRVSELPGLIQSLRNCYDQLLALKRQDVCAEVQAAMGEIHQAANPDQTDIVNKADAAFSVKRQAALDASTLTQLDAMMIQIANLRQQYLKALVVVETPDTDTVTVSRNSLCGTAKLENEADIQRYVAEIQKKLLEKLHGHDVLHVI